MHRERESGEPAAAFGDHEHSGLVQRELEVRAELAFALRDQQCAHSRVGRKAERSSQRPGTRYQWKERAARTHANARQPVVHRGGELAKALDPSIPHALHRSVSFEIPAAEIVDAAV